MKPGRELDELVLTKVMGLKLQSLNEFAPHAGPVTLPPYSTDKQAAWKVFERIQELGGDVLGRFIEECPSFQARRIRPGEKTPIIGEEVSAFEICIAAFKAVGAL